MATCVRAARAPAAPSRLCARLQRGRVGAPRASAADVGGGAPAAKRYAIALRRPLGIVLEEKGSSGVIYVAEVVEGGRAAKTGMVEVGDRLVATSAMVRSKTQDYQGVSVATGEQFVRLATAGETFDTVMAAIGSNPSQVDIKLEFERD
mmetsp:Transcript_23004/g.78338  ORF Transcript_23004/g.78338 Transcript_23004/m.78338 type:complete len:149 (-) Transcript_23004:167-613(-)